MMRYACVLVIVAGSLAATGPAPRPQKPYTGTVEALAVDAASLGSGWKCRPGIVVEDPQNPPTVKKKQEPNLAGILEAIESQDLRACGDFAYVPAGKDFDLLTLRVSVFKSKEAARKWWQRVFGGHRCWERYRPVAGYGDEAVDSLRTYTRIARQGNVVLTCSQSSGWDASHLLLGATCARIRDLCEDVDAPATQPGETAEDGQP